MGLSDTRRPSIKVMHPLLGCQSTTLRLTGLPGSWLIFLHVPSSNTPESHAAACVGASRHVRASPFGQVGRSHGIDEAESGSFAYGSLIW